jgi:hypothetical protein
MSPLQDPAILPALSSPTTVWGLYRMPWKNPSRWTVPLISKKSDGKGIILYNF